MTERNIYADPTQIGKQQPLEVFENCLDLHGDFIRQIHKTAIEDFEFIVAYIKDNVRKNENYFRHFDVGRFKLYLNEKVRTGRDKIRGFNPKEVEPIVEKKKEEKIRFSMMDESFGEKNDQKKEQPKAVYKDSGAASSNAEVSKPKKEETRVCEDCHVEKNLENDFSKNRYGKLKICKACNNVRKIAGRKKNEEKTPKKVSETKKPEPETTPKQEKQEKSLLPVEKGPGLYFIAAILKDKNTGELSHVTDQIKADGPECAVGQFVLREDVQSEIIISIGYEKAIFN